MIEFLCTVAGLIAGMAIIASLVSARQEHSSNILEETLDLIDAENMQGAAKDLQSLSKQVFSNVQAHRMKVESINSSLIGASADVPEKLLSSINEIIHANHDMQGQLIEAQSRIEKLSELIEQTTRQARTDSLTGLGNRRALDDHLNGCLNNMEGSGCIGLLLMDIDRFKNFNDTYGHSTGDGVLKCFARSLVKVCGENAFPARYGGEEFAVVLTSQDEQSMVEQAARIRKFASEQQITHEDLELTITASGGLCFLRESDTLNSAYERSDKGLYKAKESGRNRGYWLSKSGWLPFPDVSLDPAAESSPGKELGTDWQTNESPGIADAEGPSQTSKKYLELPLFVERTSDHLKHLQRTGLPAGCFMVEALGETLDEECLQNLVAIVSQKLRGIDLICLYRPLTLCVFLPGCSAETVAQRACDLLALLNGELDSWSGESKPTQFAIAVGHSLENEDAAPMLNRIEQALEDARDASPTELVVHTGHSTYFQQV
jgi:diguanylate cyclase (GGDEF)-like protein